MYCKNCGNLLNELDKFCSKCGNKVIEENLNNENKSISNQEKNNLNDIIDNVASTTNNKKIKSIRISDFLCCFIGVLISIFFSLAFMILKDAVSLFGLLFGVSLIPIIYKKLKLKPNIIIIIRILIPVVLFVFFCISCSNYESDYKNIDTSKGSKNEKINNESIIKNIKESLISTDEYNGVYTIEYEYSSDNIVKGVLEINNNVLKINYIYTGGSVANINKKEGICGINESEKRFYIVFKDTYDNKYDSIYVCNKEENGIICEKKSEFDFLGYKNINTLNFYKNDGLFYDIINRYKEETEKKIEEKNEKALKLKKEKEEYERKKRESEMNSYQEYNFEQLARNPNSVKGNKVKVTGEIVQVLADGFRVDITYNGYYYTDTIYVKYIQNVGEDKFLVKDNITIYGIADGEFSYITVFGAQVTVPQINAKIITLNK